MPGKHDIGVPAPFQQGQDSESSLDVSIHPPAGAGAAQSGAEPYVNIAQVCLAASAYTYDPWPDDLGAIMSSLHNNEPREYQPDVLPAEVCHLRDPAAGSYIPKG